MIDRIWKTFLQPAFMAKHQADGVQNRAVLGRTQLGTVIEHESEPTFQVPSDKPKGKQSHLLG
jgi:hypothetical protein